MSDTNPYRIENGPPFSPAAQLTGEQLIDRLIEWNAATPAAEDGEGMQKPDDDFDDDLTENRETNCDMRIRFDTRRGCLDPSMRHLESA